MQNAKTRWSAVVGVFFAVGASVAVGAADYPQVRGPHRDGHADGETGLLKDWPTGEGPPLLWEAAGVGRGYSQPIVVAGVVYVTGDFGNDLAVSALDAKTGQALWRRTLKGEGWNPGHRNGWPGARGTPTYDAETKRLFLVTAQGAVLALDAADGKTAWSRKMAEWGGKAAHWGYAESPLVRDRLAIVTPGGANTMVAVDKITGKDVWKSVGANLPAHYSSAIAVTVGKTTLAVNGTGGGLVGVDIATGKVAFTNPFCAGNTANCPAPLFDGNLLFWANGYNKGGITLTLSQKDGGIVAEEKNRLEGAQVQHGGYVRAGDLWYACGDRGFVCFSPAEGKVLWTDRKVGKGSIHYADGLLYCFGERGTLTLVEPGGDGAVVKGQFGVKGQGMSWAYPVVAERRLLIRHGEEGDTLYAYDVAAK